MAESKNHYEVLGIPPQATEAEIKHAYRRLVRTYHPDVSVDKLAGRQRFIEIVAAYQTLSDPIQRAFYDQKLVAERRLQEAERRRRFEEEFRRKTIEADFTSAEIYYIRGDLTQAEALCRKVLKANPRHPEAYALLGEICRRSPDRIDEAAEMFSYAVQFDPQNELYQRKLEHLAARKESTPGWWEDPAGSAEEREEGHTAERPTLFAVGMTAAALFVLGFSVAYVRLGTSPLLLEYVPSAPLVLGPLIAFFAGAALVLLLVLRPFDDDFFGSTVAGATGSGAVPLGLYLAVTGAIWFYLALVFFLVVCLVEEQFWLSSALAFVSVLVILGALAVADWSHHAPILLFCGNTTFLGFLAGWAFGSMGRRPW